MAMKTTFKKPVAPKKEPLRAFNSGSKKRFEIKDVIPPEPKPKK